MPSVALPPDSELFFGAMVSTPLPLAVKPGLGGIGAGRQVRLHGAADVDAQRARTTLAEVVGGPDDEAVWWVRWYRLNPMSKRPTTQMMARLAYQLTGIWPR